MGPVDAEESPPCTPLNTCLLREGFGVCSYQSTQRLSVSGSGGSPRRPPAQSVVSLSAVSTVATVGRWPTCHGTAYRSVLTCWPGGSVVTRRPVRAGSLPSGWTMWPPFTLARPAVWSRRSNASRSRQGGEPGARLATRLGMSVSPDTLLRRIGRAATDPCQAPRVVGVDDWAWRRGQRYGTLLCDLERHHPVDLLPERSAESLSVWLAEHPEIQVISRDRAGCYAQGASAGAPQAVQIADRWHLLRNLRDALERMIDRRHQQIVAAAHAVAANNSMATGQPVRIADLVANIDRPDYPAMPSPDEPLPMIPDATS